MCIINDHNTGEQNFTAGLGMQMFMVIGTGLCELHPKKRNLGQK